jgi:long-chain acyl-CoA synthetase
MNEKKAASLYPKHIAFQFAIPDITMCDILQERAKQYCDNPALTFYDKVMTYGELAYAVEKFASSLQQQGIKRAIALLLCCRTARNMLSLIMQFCALARL